LIANAARPPSRQRSERWGGREDWVSGQAGLVHFFVLGCDYEPSALAAEQFPKRNVPYANAVADVWDFYLPLGTRCRNLTGYDGVAVCERVGDKVYVGPGAEIILSASPEPRLLFDPSHYPRQVVGRVLVE
jgi:hypothetical protein